MTKVSIRILLVAFAISAALLFAYFGTLASKTNIILIVIDTARADRFSSYGYHLKTTPNIDRFAQDAVLFSNAHSVAPWTLPAHMSMFTGLLPGQHGATWKLLNKSWEPADYLFRPGDQERILTNRLNKAGYVTWGFSSNPWVGARQGFSLGFDLFVEPWRTN